MVATSHKWLVLQMCLVWLTEFWLFCKFKEPHMASGYYILDSTSREDKMPEKYKYRQSYCFYLESALTVKSI